MQANVDNEKSHWTVHQISLIKYIQSNLLIRNVLFIIPNGNHYEHGNMRLVSSENQQSELSQNKIHPIID